MPGWVQDGPFGLVFGFLLVVVFFRAQATYWLGRAVAAGALRSRWSRAFDAPRLTRGAAALRRWGWPAIPFSFLTIGFQSAVNGSAGMLRMPWPRYTLAMLPGCVVWAAAYALGGMAAFTAAVALAARSPWALAAAVAALGVAVVLVTVLRVRRRTTDPGRGDMGSGVGGALGSGRGAGVGSGVAAAVRPADLSASWTRRTGSPPGPPAPPI